MQRLVVCGGSLGRWLSAFGIADRVVAADTDTHALPGFGESLDLGPDCRGATELPPPGATLALVAGPLRAVADGIEATGVPTWRVDPLRIGDFVALHHRLGALVGREERARILVSETIRSIARVTVGLDFDQRVRTLWVAEDEAPGRHLVLGGDGILHDVLERAGGENVFHREHELLVSVSRAEILAREPDLLLDGRPEAGESLASLSLPVLRLGPALTRRPVLDPSARVHALHALLHPQSARGPREARKTPDQGAP